MRVISRKALKVFAARHKDAETSLDTWYRIAKQATWSNITEVRKVYPHADAVGKFTVFNIRANHYRVITEINYERQKVYIRNVLTHSQYDQGTWKR